MTLTAAAQWLNTAFAGYDKAILKIMHSLAGALGPVLTPLMKLSLSSAKRDCSSCCCRSC